MADLTQQAEDLGEFEVVRVNSLFRVLHPVTESLQLTYTSPVLGVHEL